MTSTAADGASVREALITVVTGGDVARGNPYPLYARLRDDPVHRSELGPWIVSSHAGCDTVLRNPAFRRRHGGTWELRAQLQGATGRRWFDHQERWMLWLDPPDHGRIRGLVSRAFTPRYVDALRPRVQSLVEGLVDGLVEAGEADAVAMLALPLPITVICDMLGIPPADRMRFRDWTVALASTLQPLPQPAVQDAADVATAAMEEYFATLVESRRASPGDDLLTAMIAAKEAGDRLTREELIANAALLLAAGFETTTNLIGNGLLALLRNPAQWRRLVDDQSLAENATEELLRYDAPVQIAGSRVATRDVEVDGQMVSEGELVVAVIGAGNRDPRRHERADELDVARADPAPLSFGAGPHYCLGAALARIEGSIAFATLARRAPGLELVDDDPRWLPSVNIHGLERLRVRVTP